MWVPKWQRDEKKGIDTPMPTQVVSNEEFTPPPQSKQQAQIEPGELIEPRSDLTAGAEEFRGWTR